MHPRLRSLPVGAPQWRRDLACGIFARTVYYRLLHFLSNQRHLRSDGYVDEKADLVFGLEKLPRLQGR
jgi:hypothetical protein